MRAIEPKLFELNPKSVIKVYNTILDFVDLDFDKLKSKSELVNVLNSNSFTLEEKYFIVTYLPKYLDKKNTNSILQKKIIKYEDLGDLEVSTEAIEILNKYSFELDDVCKTYCKILKRRYNVYIKSKINLQKIDRELIMDIKDWNKLPIEAGFRNELRETFEQELSQYYDDEIINEILKNSFKLDTIDSQIKLLRIEFEKSSDIYNAFNKIYNLYRSYSEVLKNASSTNNEMLTINYEINDGEIAKIEKIKDEQKKEIELKKIESKKVEIEMTTKRNLFKERKIKSEYYNASNRLNFAKIMFLTFSRVRENYIKKRHKVSLEQYLKSVAKNL